MEENDFVIKKEGTDLIVYLGFELTVANSTALGQMLSDYRGQDISKIVFDATDLVYLSSSGIRAIIYASQEIGHEPGIVFQNCAQEIYNTLKMTGLANFFSFVENKSKTDEAGDEGVEVSEWEKEYEETRQHKLDNFAAHNDVVVYQMKLGQKED